MEGGSRDVVLVHGRVEEIFAGGLEFVLLLEAVEETSRGPEVGNASRHGYAGASNDHDLSFLVKHVEQALELWLLVLAEVCAGREIQMLGGALFRFKLPLLAWRRAVVVTARWRRHVLGRGRCLGGGASRRGWRHVRALFGEGGWWRRAAGE